jgi:septum formation protein
MHNALVPPLVLASTSPFRRALLDRLGLPYETRKPAFEEIEPPGVLPIHLARIFAEGKARSVGAIQPGQWVIGADQVLEQGGEVLRKTRDLNEAVEQLVRLSGSTHRLHTSLVLHQRSSGREVSETVTVELMMRKLDRALLERYVELDQPVGSAGGYLYEKRGICLFDDVRGGDESAIVGLPLPALARLLRQVGLEPLYLIDNV